ncbi:hypothetical protein M433DRAFT_466036 [Acidomyces richmondensis BFW]|nr:MAG: hypothetical protein FE78DRAFT_275205 [Acidomyces sp. 'richmondensis']KYG41588.1 hypothetical protein M433DRAFT_466036 [Acidomyces richmondensis BFW]
MRKVAQRGQVWRAEKRRFTVRYAFGQLWTDNGHSFIDWSDADLLGPCPCFFMESHWESGPPGTHGGAFAYRLGTFFAPHGTRETLAAVCQRGGIPPCVEWMRGACNPTRSNPSTPSLPIVAPGARECVRTRAHHRTVLSVEITQRCGTRGCGRKIWHQTN